MKMRIKHNLDKLKILRPKNLRRIDKRYFFVAAFALIGVATLLYTRAASNTAFFEAESGALSGASQVADGSASGGDYLLFGDGQPASSGSGLDFPSNPTYQRSYISQYGITWNFDKEYTVGQYVNGDWWVVGPVTLVSITPAANKTSFYNGENINPVKGTWNYDKDITGTSASNFQAFNYPRNIAAGSSIVKTISRPADRAFNSHPRGALQTAAVLTVVSAPPPKNGAIAFRPPYFGTDKQQYLTTNLKMNLWPSLSAPSSLATSAYPSLAEANSRFSRVQMDFGVGTTFNERLHANDNGGVSYGGYLALAINNTVLRLMLNEPVSQKTQGIVSIVQYGIDLAPMIKAGSHICADINFNCAGHGGGRHLPISIAATLLDAQPIKDAINNHQDAFIQNYGINDRVAPTPLWGDKICTVDEYFAIFHNSSASGSRSCRDPYGYIDGGYFPGASYQGINTANYTGDVVALHLMPALKLNWPQSDKLIRYIDRTKDFGAWTLPDPYNRDPGKHGDKSTISSSTYESKLAEAFWIERNLSSKITTNWGNL